PLSCANNSGITVSILLILHFNSFLFKWHCPRGRPGQLQENLGNPTHASLQPKTYTQCKEALFNVTCFVSHNRDTWTGEQLTNPLTTHEEEKRCTFTHAGLHLHLNIASEHGSSY